MEILTLKLLVSEDSANRLLAARLQEQDVPVEDLAVKFRPEGIVVSGTYPTFVLKVPFETLLAVTVNGGLILVRFESIKVSGLPAGKLRGLLLKSIQDAAQLTPGIEVRDERVEIDLEQVLEARQVPLRLNLKAIRCSVGSLVLEADRTP